MESNSDCEVKGENNIGGFAGTNERNSKIFKCSSSGTVNGDFNVGGLVGLNNEKSVNF